jgi:hypothetical protein
VRRAVVLLAALLLAGCGKTDDEPGAASPRETFELFVTAVNEGSPDSADLVTRRLDEETRKKFVDAVREDVKPLGRIHRVILEEVVGEKFAVVAAQGEEHPGPGAFASTLVRDGERWLIEPRGLDLVYGTSALADTPAAKPVVDFQVNTTDGDVQARMWIDGNEVRLRKQAGGTYVAGIKRLMPRLYSVVAFARVGDRVGAIAWTFTAR